MARRIERRALKGDTPGAHHEVMFHRYGAAGGGPKAYLQGSLHADETPGMMALHHLIPMLDQADRDGRLRGEIVIVPYANPIGLGQFVNQSQLGRYALSGDGNFNRNWPDLIAVLHEEDLVKLGETLTGKAEDNIKSIRALLSTTVAGREPRDLLDSLRLTLAQEAVDADIVLDLHCDDEALVHAYLIPQHWPEAKDLVAELECRAALLAEDSGGGAFDEAFSTPWIKLAKRFPDHPIPPACFATTVELRGRADVSDELGRKDATGLFNFLRHRGFIASEAADRAPPEALCDATDLTATEVINAPASGILCYEVDIGDEVSKGDIIAWLIDPAAENPPEGRQAITAGTSGLVLSRRNHKYVSARNSVAKIVGTEPLESRSGGPLVEA